MSFIIDKLIDSGPLYYRKSMKNHTYLFQWQEKLKRGRQEKEKARKRTTKEEKKSMITSMIIKENIFKKNTTKKKRKSTVPFMIMKKKTKKLKQYKRKRKLCMVTLS